jgi:arylformamidase
LRRAAAALALALALAPGAGGEPAPGRPQVLEGLAYAGDRDPQRSLDLYLPASGAPAPLLAFVHSRFFDRADHADEVARLFARPLQRAGAAVAVIRHRLAPAHRHPEAADDVAAALAFLLRDAERRGIDRRRVVLAGHSSGATFATLLALDPRYLAAHGLAPGDLRGVAAISGIYDLDPPEGAVSAEERALYVAAFGDAAARRAASPLRHVRPDAPLMLALVAQRDVPGVYEGSFAFTQALRDVGHPAAETFVVPGRDHFSILDMSDARNPARGHLLALLGLSGGSGSIEDEMATRRYWRDPAYSTRGFWSAGVPVETHDADERFLAVLNLMFAKPGRPRPLRPERFQAVDLLAWLDARGPARVGRGRWLRLTNARGEQLVFDEDAIRPYRPVVVIGLDGERKLFSLTDVYHTRLRYTWTGDAPETWLLARPLGAFLYFMEPPPPELDPRGIGRFALLPGGFARSETDPWAPLRTLPPRERELLTSGLQCVSCHSFRGVGARAGHIRARDGQLVGGFALALEAYPPEVWRRYCFEQEAVAAEIGASPIPFDAPTARALYQLVESSRASARAADGGAGPGGGSLRAPPPGAEGPGGATARGSR